MQLTTYKVVKGLNAHCDFDECPCSGPYALTGLCGEYYGIAWGNSEQEVVDKAQETNADVYYAQALDASDLHA